jgi:hypothetical protein
MNCEDVRASLLSGDSSDAISSHLSGCVECRRSIDDIGSIRANLSSESLWAEPPPNLEESVVARITAPQQSTVVDAPRTIGDSIRRLRRGAVVAMVGSAAAVLVLMVVAGLLLVTRSPAPDWEAAMVGTDTAPSATAVVAGWNVESGTRVVLKAVNLGQAPEGFVYQLWFSRGSTDVSGGTFIDPSLVELTVGVTRRDYPDVWISLDPIDSGDIGTGPAVLYTNDR